MTASPLVLRLYVAGDAPNSVAAVANLGVVLARFPGRSVELEVVDVVVYPERGLVDGVMVTPMLVKLGPPPVRRLLGNLRDHELLLGALGLVEVVGE